MNILNLCIFYIYQPGEMDTYQRRCTENIIKIIDESDLELAISAEGIFLNQKTQENT